MKMYEQLVKYNAIRLSMPTYQALTPKNTSYEEVYLSNGKEMKEMSQYPRGVATQSLQGGSPALCPTVNRAIACTWQLLDFDMYLRYKSHDDAILCYMQDALNFFHTVTEGFLLEQSGKQMKPKANALRWELVKKLQVRRKQVLNLGHHSKSTAKWTPRAIISALR